MSPLTLKITKLYQGDAYLSHAAFSNIKFWKNAKWHWKRKDDSKMKEISRSPEQLKSAPPVRLKTYTRRPLENLCFLTKKWFHSRLWSIRMSNYSYSVSKPLRNDSSMEIRLASISHSYYLFSGPQHYELAGFDNHVFLSISCSEKSRRRTSTIYSAWKSSYFKSSGMNLSQKKVYLKGHQIKKKFGSKAHNFFEITKSRRSSCPCLSPLLVLEIDKNLKLKCTDCLNSLNSASGLGSSKHLKMDKILRNSKLQMLKINTRGQAELRNTFWLLSWYQRHNIDIRAPER